MTDHSTIRTRREDRLWTLLGAIELTYHPALALALLLVVEFLVRVPVVTLDPLSIAVGVRGVPLTTFLAGVVLLDLASDVVGVYVTVPAETRGDADE